MGPREKQRAQKQSPAGCDLRATRLLRSQAAGGRCGSSGGSAGLASPAGTSRGPYTLRTGLPPQWWSFRNSPGQPLRRKTESALGVRERGGEPPGSARPSPSWPRPPRLGRLYPGTQHHSRQLTQQTSFLLRLRMRRLPRQTERPYVRGVATFGSHPGRTPSGGRSLPIRSRSSGRSPEPMKW